MIPNDMLYSHFWTIPICLFLLSGGLFFGFFCCPVSGWFWYALCLWWGFLCLHWNIFGVCFVMGCCCLGGLQLKKRRGPWMPTFLFAPQNTCMYIICMDAASKNQGTMGPMLLLCCILFLVVSFVVCVGYCVGYVLLLFIVVCCWGCNSKKAGDHVSLVLGVSYCFGLQDAHTCG